jgi:hypothetical protein
VGVCDTPGYFHDFIDHTILSKLGSKPGAGGTDGAEAAAAAAAPPVAAAAATAAVPSSASVMTVLDGAGGGYAVASDAELALVLQVAQESAVVLDPVRRHARKLCCAASRR